MRAAKVDDNQKEIVQAFRQMGCTVTLLHAVGQGCPDLLVGVNGFNILAEVKDGNKPPSKQKLTPDQERWHDEWRGQKVIINSVEKAIRTVNYYRSVTIQAAEQ